MCMPQQSAQRKDRCPHDIDLALASGSARLGDAFMGRWVLLTIIFLLCSIQSEAWSAASEEFSISDTQGNDISVERSPSDGDLLVIWLVDHDEHRPMFEAMLESVHAAGIELWRVDLLDAYFLPRSSETVRTLPGEGMAALIEAAHRQSDKTILVAAYDRMPLPLLRGVRLWQSRQQGTSRLAGAVLFYPNLFGPPPPAGEPPQLDPILHQTNIPLTLFQPMHGNHRWRLQPVMDTLWAGGSPAFVYLVPEVRDWYFMHEPGENPAESAATAAVPGLISRFARLMAALPKPAPRPLVDTPAPGREQILGLVALSPPPSAPPILLPDAAGGRLPVTDYLGKVTLLNFWATWCPPCVDELPSLNRLQQHFNQSPFRLVSVDFRESAAQIRRFTDRVPVDFPVLLDLDGRTAMEWQVFSFPSSFLIGKDGRIRYSVNRAIDWNEPQVLSLVQQLLDE